MHTVPHIGLETESVIIFTLLAIAGLIIDLYAHRADKPISLKAATFWSLFWVAVGVTFGIFLNFHFSSEVASLYFAGYAFEMALSVDNLFAIMAVFAWFGIKSGFTHRVLYWGVLGAVVFRLIFVLVGTSLFALGPYVEFVFSFMVALSAILMIKKKESDETSDFSGHPAYKFVRFFMPIYPKLVGHNFFLSKHHVEEELKKEENKNVELKRKGALFCTPLFLCLAIVETSDVMFAFDSVPAVIAVSQDPFIVYSCMIMAIMGLRSMYFILDALRNALVYLEKAVIFLLFFVAFKLAAAASLHLFGFGLEISVYTSLIVIAISLGTGVITSLLFGKKAKKEA
ncbi:MAG: TerC/Alx family metal homeostasis membrane protein [Succinatimonas sp.]|jgi:tellurite resistance protein TerC|nr:TerC/Alx family metal homeostasis membrane protein [Succinatimonas sp.]MDY5722134.1 TerC/Alx family metal homeostasis membrane protein [Succinivibrio sp.]